MTQIEVAQRLDYIDNMDELEAQLAVEAYDREQKFKKVGTVVIIILAIAVSIVLIHNLMIKG